MGALWFASKRSVFLLYRGARILLVPRAGGPVPGSQETERHESLQGPGLGPTSEALQVPVPHCAAPGDTSPCPLALSASAPREPDSWVG